MCQGIAIFSDNKRALYAKKTISHSARDAARDAAWGIVADLSAYKKKYKEVPFKKLVDLWEMGLYPVGLVKGKFLIYVPYKNKKGERVKIV